MPCYLVITVLLENEEFTHKAAKELGLELNKDYRFDGGRVYLLSEKARQLEGRLKQMYGVTRAESLARRKGLNVRREKAPDGVVRLHVG